MSLPASLDFLVGASVVARYEHLPLYKTAMALTVYIETVGGDHFTERTDGQE